MLFDRDGTLMAEPFDVASRRFTGDPFPIAENVGSEGTRYASFSASASGVLVYARGVSRPTMRITWVDRAGRRLGTVGEPGNYSSIALSSDERRVAAAMQTSGDYRDIWNARALHLRRGKQQRRDLVAR